MRKLVEFWHPKGVVIAEAWRKKIYIPFRDVPTVFFDCDPAFVPKGRPNVLHATKPICEAVVRELLSIGCTSVADLCGFPSALVMRRQFRARTGTTPTAWREKSRRSARPLA